MSGDETIQLPYVAPTRNQATMQATYNIYSQVSLTHAPICATIFFIEFCRILCEFRLLVHNLQAKYAKLSKKGS
jgi:hypothetical protein